MDYLSYEVELNERKLVQQRAKVAYEKEKEKLKEFISREGTFVQSYIPYH